MSAKLSNKIHQRIQKVGARVGEQKKERRPFNLRMFLLLPAWVTAAFIASNLIVSALDIALVWLHLSPENYLRPAVLETLVRAIIYGLTIAIVIAVPWRLYRYQTNLATLGLTRLASWTDIGLAPVGFIVYIFVVSIVFGLIQSWLPFIPLNQTQEVGFQAIGSQVDNTLAFLTLVVVAPIAEETLFRGYLYGKLKGYVPVVWAAIATSLLFAVAHWNISVGIDVFILSLVLCWFRSLTGSIWAGVLVHMLKNLVAYYLLFISPLIGG